MNTDGASITELMALYNPVLPVVNGGYGAGQARLLPIHIWQITGKLGLKLPATGVYFHC